MKYLQLAKHWPTSVIASFIILSTISGCKKDAPVPADSQSSVSNQGVSERENDVTYYLVSVVTVIPSHKDKVINELFDIFPN